MAKSKIPNWTELPSELVREIADRQTSYIDYVRTRSTCKNWEAAIPKRPNEHVCKLPILLLPYHQKTPGHRGFYNIPDHKTYHLQLPEALEKHCCGSSNGWLVMVKETPEIFLLNPITRARIDLPPLSTLPLFPTELIFHNCMRLNQQFILKEQLHVRDTFVVKAILSADPSVTSDFMVVIIFGSSENLAFCKPRDSSSSSWTVIDMYSRYKDVIFRQGKLFAVDQLGRVSTCDINNVESISPSTSGSFTMTRLVNVSPVLTQTGYNMQWYLASLDERDEGLLLVARYRKVDVPLYEYKTERFEVFKLDRSRSWLKMESLGDTVMFLGSSSSLSISARDYGNNIRGNCIYFTDDYKRIFKDYVLEGHDFGIFYFDDGCVTSLDFSAYPVEQPSFTDLFYYQQTFNRDTSLFILPPPIWVTISP